MGKNIGKKVIGAIVSLGLVGVLSTLNRQYNYTDKFKNSTAESQRYQPIDNPYHSSDNAKKVREISDYLIKNPFLGVPHLMDLKGVYMDDKYGNVKVRLDLFYFDKNSNGIRDVGDELIISTPPIKGFNYETLKLDAHTGEIKEYTICDTEHPQWREKIPTEAIPILVNQLINSAYYGLQNLGKK